MLRFLFYFAVFLPHISHAQHMPCPKGYQPYANRCVSQAMADYISCLEASGGNKQAISEEVSQLGGNQASGDLKVFGGNPIARGGGSIAVDKKSETALIKKLETKWFPGGISGCAKALQAQHASTMPDAKRSNESRYIASVIKVRPEKFSTRYETKNELFDKLQTVNVLINYPQVTGHPDIRVERKLNELLKKTTGVYTKHEEEKFDHVIQYEIISLEYNMLIISLRADGQYVGAATSMTATTTLNINLANGEPFEFKDLFRAGYQANLLKLVEAKARCASGGSLLHKPELRDNHPFYLRAGRLYIQYQRREICPGVDGPIDIEIDLDQVKSFINPNGPVNYIL